MLRMLRSLIQKRKVDSTTDTTQQDHTIFSGFKAGAQFDDKIDTAPEISHTDSLRIILRGYRWLKYVKWWFAAKWLMSASILIPGLFIGWFWKIIVDHIILQEPLVADNVNFPPHMYWLLKMLEGREPLDIALILATVYLVGLFTIGTRVDGTGAGLYGGRDAASNAENAISGGQGGGFGGSRAGGIWGIVEWWISVRLCQRFINSLRTDLFKRLVRSPMTTIDDHRVGDSLYRTLYDTPMVFTNVTETVFTPFFIFAWVGLTFYQLWWTYAEVSMLIIVLMAMMIPITIITTLAPSKWIRRMTQNQRAASAATTNVLEETMNNISAVQSLGAMKQEKTRFAKRSAHAYWRTRIAMFPWVGVELILEIIRWPLAFYLSWHVTNLVIDDQLTVGDFGALYGMYMSLQSAFQQLGKMWLNLQDQAAASRRVFFFLDQVIDEEEHQPGNNLPPIRQGVRFKGVNYHYPNGHQALKNINLDLKIGNVIAIVGPTGCGKTSLAYMLPGFLKPTSGEVLFDNQDVMSIDLTSLRDQTAYIFQEHLLLSEPIRSNLQLANPDATEADLFRALETAGCMEFVSKLPQGIDTVLGRSGDTLSVGQQQRLSIARGLLRDARILILDEPTAALDPQTENILVRSLRSESKDRLVVVIAHRLSTIRQADQIIFLDDGEVKEVGDHETLMSHEDGPYREFVNLQTATSVT